MSDRAGQELGNYRLLRLLGHGGFAEVYLAEHRFLERKCAVKILTGKMTEDDIKDFLREARTIAALKHPHILPVFDFGMDVATPFLVMEYAANGTLRDRHKHGTQVPLPTVVEYVKHIADALQFAHDARVIHRDVKPENMLIDEHNALLLSDFGIAVIAHSTSSMRTIDKIGTPHYMSPEQFQGKPVVASDQYALAVVVYEWLCGQRPYIGDSFYSIGMQHFSSPVPPLRIHNAGLSPEIETVMQIALAKDSKDRFADVQAFAHALEQAVLPSATSVPLPPNAQLEPTVLAGSAPPLAPTIPAVPPAISTPHPPNEQVRTPAIRQPLGATLLTYSNHSRPICTVAWSPDGTRLASAGDDQMVQVWSADTGRDLLTYKDHSKPVYSVAWSPDGTRIASAGNDNAVHIWSTQTGKRLVAYRDKARRVNVVAWSPDGTRLAVAWSLDGEYPSHMGVAHIVQIWDVQTNNLSFTYTRHSNRVNVVAWSPDSTRIVSGSDNRAVRIWDARTGSDLLMYWDHAKVISAVAWSPDSTLVASASKDFTVRVWNAQTGENVCTYRDYDLIPSIAWSPDSEHLAFAGHYRAVKVLDVNTGSCQFTYSGHSNDVLSVAWSPDGSRIASGGKDKIVRVWQAI